MKFLPESYLILEDKLNSDPILFDQIVSLIKQYTHQIFISEKVQKHKTYCGDFYIPSSIEKNLMKIIGVSTQKLRNDYMDMVESGYKNWDRDIHKTVYITNNPFYLSLMYFYLYAVRSAKKHPHKSEDLKLAILAISYAKMWNGRISKYYKNGCDDKYANYVQQLVLTNKSKLKKHKTPTDLIFKYFIIKHKAYGDKDGLDLYNNPDKMTIFLYQIWSRVNALVRRVSIKYYDAYKEGKSIVVDSNMGFSTNDAGKEKELVEKNETRQHLIAETVEEIKHYLLYGKFKMPDNILRHFRATPYMLTTETIQTMYEQIHNDDDVIDKVELIISYLIEYLMITHKLSEPHEICKVGLVDTVNKIISSRRNEKLKMFKIKCDECIEEIYKIHNMSKFGSITNQIKIRKMFLFVITSIIAKNVCRSTLKL